MEILNSYAYQIVCMGKDDNMPYNIYIACFDGCAYYKANNRYFVATYPMLNNLTRNDANEIFKANGCLPTNGEFGMIYASLGIVSEIRKDDFYKAIKDYPVRMDDYSLLGW